MTYNRAGGQSPDELLDRSVAALVREWGVTEAEAREAILRVQRKERRHRRNGAVIRLPDCPEVDLTDWTIDPGWVYFYGRVEC